MKKILLMLLAAVTLILSACGAGTGQIGNPAGATVEPPEMFMIKAGIEETVMVDKRGVKITATELSYTSYSAELELTIENNSGKDLSFLCNTLRYSCNSVNGYMINDGYLNTDVPDGETVYEVISFSADELLALGITDIADIEIGFDVVDEDYDSYLRTGPIQVTTSMADICDYSADTYQTAMTSGWLTRAYNLTLNHFAKETLYDQNSVMAVSAALITDEDGGKYLFAEFENTSPDQIYVTTSDFFLNGLQIEGSRWSSDFINAGKRRVLILSLTSMLDSACWDLFGITDIADIVFSVGLRNENYNELCSEEELRVAVAKTNSSYDSTGEVLYKENDIRIIYKGLAEDSFAYSDDIHVLFLVENNCTEQIYVDTTDNTLSVNGQEVRCLCYGTEIMAGRSGILDVEIQGNSLTENGISDMADIASMELSVTAKNEDYRSLAKVLLTVEKPVI